MHFLPSTGNCTQVNCIHVIVKFYIHSVLLLLLLFRKESLQTSSVHGVTHDIVMRVTESLRGKGHHLYMDNFYTSPALFHSLKRVGIYSCGTLRCNRRGVPPVIKKKGK